MKKVIPFYIHFLVWLLLPLITYSANSFANSSTKHTPNAAAVISNGKAIVGKAVAAKKKYEKSLTKTESSKDASIADKTVVDNSATDITTDTQLSFANSSVDATPVAFDDIVCLGEKSPYKTSLAKDMKAIQDNLWDIYHNSAEWKSEADETGKPLSDGVMGPITWSWMNRFCANFALNSVTDNNDTNIQKNIIAELPSQLIRIASFTKNFPPELAILISSDFFRWYTGQQESSKTGIATILHTGSNSELVALVHRYQSRNKVPSNKPKVVIAEIKSPNTLYVYALRADDLTKLQQPNLLPDAIKKLIDTPFSNDSDADAAIAKALKSLSKDVKTKASQLIHQQLTTQISYQLTEGVLASLASTSLNSLQIAALNNASKELFTDEDGFKKEITAALKTVPAQNAQQNNDQSSSSADADASTATNNSELRQADLTVARIQVLNASRKTSLLLTAQGADEVIDELVPPDTPSALHPLVVKLLGNLQDIEFPDGDLLHSAAQTKLTKGINNCELNKSNTIESNVKLLSDEEKLVLKSAWEKSTSDPAVREAISAVFSVTDRRTICDENYFFHINTIYNALIKSAIANLYRKDLPAYSNLPINWSGKLCGCIPKEIESTAYGIYPYWHITAKEQNFDFSTFSRVAYYGLSFNSNGQLLQTNTNDQTKAIFNQPNKESYQFITNARTYGSKVDWMIEKDWNEELTGNADSDLKKIESTLNGLHNNILNLLKTQLSDYFSRFKTFTTLGLAQRPTKGDGVTLYFKHYPQSAGAKKLFDDFFKSLKADLNQASVDNGRFRNIKEKYFVNIVVAQSDFETPNNIFSNANLDQIIGIDSANIENQTALETQERVRSLILVLLNEPYYNSLSEIYAMSTAQSRDIILPIMFTDYKNFNPALQDQGHNDRSLFDERRKNLSFIQEGFGGGGFWSMPMWDDPASESFNKHIAIQFALGFPQSWWADKVCGYRWIIVAIMDLWICIALGFVLFAFYIFPQSCRKLPFYLEILLHPAVLAALILPPIALWIYLLIADHQYPFLSIPSLFTLILLGLSCNAIMNYVKELRQHKPTRNLAQNSRARVPTRSK